MSGQQLYLEQHQKRLYFSALARTTIIALTSKRDGAYPWESEPWTSVAADMCDFLSNPASEYGQTQEDYDKLMRQISAFTKQNKWLSSQIHKYSEKEQLTYLPPKPASKKKVVTLLALAILAGIVLTIF